MEKLQLPLKNISTVFPSKFPKGNAEFIFLCNTQKHLKEVASAIFSTSIMAFLKIHQRFEGHFLNKLSFKNSQGLEHNSLLIQDCQNLA